MAHIFRSANNIYNVIICPDTYDKIISECEKYSNRETGGILTGNYSKDNSTAYIKDSYSPKDSKHYKNKFFRGINGLDKLIDKKWGEGEYYLGDGIIIPILLQNLVGGMIFK